MSTENNKRILDKVRALLSKTTENGATEHEMEEALKMAQRLMMKHNIDQDKLKMSPEDISAEMVENSYKQPERKYWLQGLLRIIADGYSCTVFRDGWEAPYYYTIVGTEDDKAMVKSLFEMTIPVIRNLYKQRYKEHCDEIIQDLKRNDAVHLYKKPSYQVFIVNYIDGFTMGLALKLRQDKVECLKLEQDNKEYQLSVIQKNELIKKHVEKNFNLSNYKTPTGESHGGAFGKGLLDGKDNGLTKKLH